MDLTWSADEQAFVESILSGNNALTGAYWFGIRETTEGVYQNVDGSPLTVTMRMGTITIRRDSSPAGSCRPTTRTSARSTWCSPSSPA